MAKNDISRMTAKIKRQQQQIKLLKKEAEAYYEGSAQLSRALDSILAQVAIKWGDQVTEGVWEAALPMICVEQSCRDYIVSARIGEDNNSYIIRVEPRGEKEKE